MEAASTSAPDRVLFLIDHFKNPHAGTEAQLHRLVTELVNRGTECHLAVLTGSDYLDQQDFPCPWSVLGHSSLGSPATWRTMYRLGRQKSREGFSLAHTYFNDASVLAPPMLTLSGIRTIISRRDMGFWYNRRNTALLRLTRRWVAGCIANSRSVADVTMRTEGIPSDRMHVVYNGLPDQAVPATGAPELAALKDQGRVLAGLVANIRPIKRIHDLIKALADIREQAPALDIALIGDGDTKELEALAKRLSVRHRVHFLGPREDVPASLSQLDIGVLCSESEGFSNAIIEYMRAGLPTICTRAGGNPEAIEDRHTGFLYAVGDTRALATQLLTLVQDPALRESMGQAAREQAIQRFSIAAMVNAHCRIYRQTVEAS